MRRALSTEQLVTWVTRALWIGLAFTVALDVSRPVAVVLWTAWAVVVVATLVTHPVSLTALRVAAPASVLAALAAASPVAVGWAVGTAAVVYSPALGLAHVNGSAYPNERRFPLRLPGQLLFAAPLAWLLLVGVPAAALVAAERDAIAISGVLGLAAVGLGVVLARALHRLSRRWLVFVPAGVVLHDHLALADPVLFVRQTVAHVAAAEEGTDALDLTLASPGLALELRLRETTELGRRVAGRAVGDALSADAVLFTPTRPGAVLREAAARRLPTA
ncbi:MAG TPA: hypothetical protein VM030_02400 [Acidimicrobiales bacterium]|nr:hypothetical protein [Acidimicrobiales bacterium]